MNSGLNCWGFVMVLVVDDDASVRQVLLDVLQIWGYEAWGVQDGRQAVHYITDPENPPPKLILLDYNMPVMNGEQFLLLREESEELKRIPVVVFTGSVDLVKIHTADGYVQKPHVSEVRPYLEKYCARRAA